jgi:UDP-glucose:(heptosyl)LPS alpha-1,3-glucosyltransferase
MKLAIIVNRLTASRGGAEGWTAGFIAWLAARGHDVEVVMSRQSDSSQFLPNARQVVINCFNRFDFAQKAHAHIQSNRYDIIHDMGFGYHCDLFHPHTGCPSVLEAAKSKRFTGIKRHLYTLLKSCSMRHRRLISLARKQYAQPATNYLAVSQMVADDMQNYHGISASQINVIHNGIDVDRFSRGKLHADRTQMRSHLGIRADETAILSVAHNHSLKGIPLLLQLLENESLANHHLVVVGGHRQRPRSIVVGKNRVTFAGPCANVDPYYAAADIFALPTFYDACSLTVLEAMACELPVITSRCNGAAEFIQHGQNGLLIDSPRDADALLRGVLHCSQKMTRQRLGSQARATMEDYTIEDNFHAIEQLYGSIVDARSVANRRAA